MAYFLQEGLFDDNWKPTSTPSADKSSIGTQFTPKQTTDVHFSIATSTVTANLEPRAHGINDTSPRSSTRALHDTLIAPPLGALPQGPRTSTANTERVVYAEPSLSGGHATDLHTLPTSHNLRTSSTAAHTQKPSSSFHQLDQTRSELKSAPFTPLSSLKPLSSFSPRLPSTFKPLSKQDPITRMTAFNPPETPNQGKRKRQVTKSLSPHFCKLSRMSPKPYSREFFSQFPSKCPTDRYPQAYG